MKIELKLSRLERLRRYSMIWPSDLVFDPISPSFELALEPVQMNILSQFSEDWPKIASARAQTPYFYDLT